MNDPVGVVLFRQLHNIYNLMKNSNLIFLLLLCHISLFGQKASITFQVNDEINEKAISKVSVFHINQSKTYNSDKNGILTISQLNTGSHQFTFFHEGYASHTETFQIDSNEQVNFTLRLSPLNYDLSIIDVDAGSKQSIAQSRLRNVEGTAIYAAKKSEVIQLDYVVANLAINNPRQVYKGIAGLNIWESDGAGLQLSIGARGLNPNRTSNFNTRQNGYDISADALGYPESYYTPPTQALQRIEIVRGAASLQYGSQFGGLLNFVFKKGNEDKPFEFLSENTVGSFGLLTSFNSIGGSKDGWNYYSFYQRKQGDGWRPNSGFEQNTAYASLHKKLNDKFQIGLEYTFMNYLAQQAGGLQDFEFQKDPRQSKRDRNWFAVNWNLAALHLDYQLNEKTKINSRSFFLYAQRDALGELGPINRPDPLRERDLVRGKYKNFGNETRLISRYDLGNTMGTFLIGGRYYQGYTTNQQGDASDGADAEFTFLNPDNLERSSYEFPSRNIAIFAENLFQINSHWTVTPGARFEYIHTASDGFYKQRVFSGGQVIFEQQFEDSKENNRSIALLGLGIGYKPHNNLELYSNISQNYRSINFSDLAVINPNLIVDSLLQDERGFNADLGIRGTALRKRLNFDASIFYLHYANRIGIGEVIIPDPVVIEKAVAFRTNIGDAHILGLETYAEFILLEAKENSPGLSMFTNLSLLHGKYTAGQSSFVGNKVESIPPFSIKTGLNFQWNNFKAAYQFNYVAKHFSDATNAEFVVNATRGTIPAYQVQDLSFSYSYKKFKFQTGVNNLLDAHYFTRRALAYPGPGVVPADGRSFYFTVGVRL